MRLGPFTGATDRAHGIAWLRIFGRGVVIHAPWNPPLFSERNGLRKVLRLFGWRIGWLRAEAEG